MAFRCNQGLAALIGLLQIVSIRAPFFVVHESNFDLLPRGPMDSVFGQVSVHQPYPNLCAATPQASLYEYSWADTNAAGIQIEGPIGAGFVDTSSGNGQPAGREQLMDGKSAFPLGPTQTIRVTVRTKNPKNNNFLANAEAGNRAGWLLMNADASQAHFFFGTMPGIFCNTDVNDNPQGAMMSSGHWVVERISLNANGVEVIERSCPVFTPYPTAPVLVEGEVVFKYSYDTGEYSFEFWNLNSVGARDENAPRARLSGTHTAQVALQSSAFMSSAGHPVDAAMYYLKVDAEYEQLHAASLPTLYRCPQWTCGRGGGYDTCIRAPGAPPLPPAAPPQPPSPPRPPSFPPPGGPPPPPHSPPPRPTRPPAYPGMKAAGDPHLSFAHGGKADFRGVDGGIFAFLSTPTLALNIMTQNATFKLEGQTVHGSFMTAAHVVAKTAKGRTLTLTMMGSKVLENKGYNAHTAYANGTCSGEGDFDLYYGGKLSCDEIQMKMGYQELDLATSEWRIRVQALDVFDWISGPKHRLDVKLNLRVPEGSLPYHPHGIMGQSYDRDDIGVNGKQDVYTPNGPELTTSALAEGAIEGVAADYQLSSKFETVFRYSRFGAKVPGGAGDRPRNVSNLSGPKLKANSSVAGFGVAGAE